MSEVAQVMADKHLHMLPKAVTDAAWAFAWEHGHANGMGDVEYYYIEVAEVALAAYGAGISAGIKASA